MRLPEIRAHLERLEFPAGDEEAKTHLEGVRLDAPNGDPVELTEILDRADETSYDSVEQLRNTVLNRIDDRHIGRKHYDDRSRSVGGDDLSF